MSMARVLSGVMVMAVGFGVSMSVQGRAQGLLTNGGFETGDLAGWETSGSVSPAQTLYGVTEGGYAVGLNCGNSNPADGMLSQSFDTVAGARYALAFDLGAYGAAIPITLTAKVLGTDQLPVLDVSVSVTTTHYTTEWIHQEHEFIANSSRSVLLLRDTSATSVEVDGALDNVRLSLLDLGEVLRIVSSTQAAGQVRIPFTYQIASSPAASGYGAAGLPAGLTLDATSGLIGGVPLVEGVFDVQLTATNGVGVSGTNLALTIASPLPLTSMYVLQPAGGANDGTDNGTVGRGKDLGQWADNGSNPDIHLYNSPCNLGFNPAYFQFSLEGMPARAISRAQVQLYCSMWYNGPTGWAWTAQPYQISLRAVDGAWDELSLPTGAAAAPIASATVTAVGGYGTPYIEFQGWLTFDVTEVYRGWANGTVVNNGVQLAIDTAYCANSDEFSVRSSDNENAELRPKLIVESEPEPLVLSMSAGVGSVALGWNSISNAIYQVETSEFLPSWSPLGGPFLGQGGPVNIVLPTTRAAAFYRVQVR